MCGAPIILSLIINAEKNEIIEIKNNVNIMTAAAAPPARRRSVRGRYSRVPTTIKISDSLKY